MFGLTHGAVVPFVILVSSFLGESKASACFQVDGAGSLTCHRELLCISLYEKLPFDLNAVKTLQGQDLKSFLGPNFGEKLTPSSS